MNQSRSAQLAKVSGGSTATSRTRALLCALCLSILAACGNGGGRATAEEGGGVVHRLLEVSSLTFSPDPPSPSSVVTEPLTGTFRLEPRHMGIAGFWVNVIELRLRAGERFVVEGAQRVAGILGATVDAEPFEGELRVTINGTPVELRGGGWVVGLGEEALAMAAHWNFCDPPRRCDEIRAGRTAGYALTIFARPEKLCAPKQ